LHNLLALVEKTCDLGNAVTGKSSASPKAKLMTAYFIYHREEKKENWEGKKN
jgi:hypothetical protein